MFYYSARALNEISASIPKRTDTFRVGFTRFFSFSKETTLVHADDGEDRVDHALKRARKQRRTVLRNAWDVTKPGTIIDVLVEDLEIGSMPFLRFGDLGEGAGPGRQVRTFWAHTSIPPLMPLDPTLRRQLILLGSIDNVVNDSWSRGYKKQVKIGHSFPSDPSVLAELVRLELGLTGPDVEEHARKIAVYDVNGPGDAALFAWNTTQRATETLIRDERHASKWHVRAPLGRARVVASVTDVYDTPSDPDGLSVLLARPVLIDERT